MFRILTSIILCLLTTLTFITFAQDNDSQPDMMLSETQDGITVTLSHYYADSTQARIWYQIEGLDLPDGQLLGAPVINAFVYSADNTSVFGAQGGGYTIEASGKISGDNQYDFNQVITEAIDVTFEIRLNQFEGMPLWLVPEDFDISQTPSDEYVYEFPHDLTFSFSVTLTPYAATIIEPVLSAESNGLSLSIEGIVLTPVRANVAVCFDLPSTGDWQPNIQLLVNDEATELVGYSLQNLPSPDDVSRCSEFRFQVPQIENPSELAFIIDGLYMSPPEIPSIDQITSATIDLAQQGIEINSHVTENGLHYEIVTMPENMSESEAYVAIYEALQIHFDVFWEFTLELEA